MENTLAKLKVDYPEIYTYVMAKLREDFDKVLEPLQGDDLAKIAEAEGALPLEAFIDEIRKGEG